jgi:hypothetical protein
VLSLVDLGSAIGILQQLTDTGPTQTLQMEKCASNSVSAPLVLLLRLQPHALSRENIARLVAGQGESLASVKDDDVAGFSTICIEERAGAIPIDRVASVRPGAIGPVVVSINAASGRANGAALPVSVKDVEAHLFVTVSALHL